MDSDEALSSQTLIYTLRDSLSIPVNMNIL